MDVPEKKPAHINFSWLIILKSVLLGFAVFFAGSLIFAALINSEKIPQNAEAICALVACVCGFMAASVYTSRHASSGRLALSLVCCAVMITVMLGAGLAFNETKLSFLSLLSVSAAALVCAVTGSAFGSVLRTKKK